MFNFTTTRVINAIQTYDHDRKSIEQTEKGDLFVAGVNTFKKDCITKIFKKEATTGSNGTVTIDLPDFNAGDIVRLTVPIKLSQSDNTAMYANDLGNKGITFTAEIKVKTPGSIAEEFVKTIKSKGLFVREKEIVTVSGKGKVLTITGTNYYQRFDETKVEKYVYDGNPFESFYEDAGATITTIQPVEAFGDYNWMLRNIVLPTHEHTRAFAPRSEEMAIPGATYNQYTIHYRTERGPIEISAVGALTTSVTTHVLYVKSDLATEVEAAFAGLPVVKYNKTEVEEVEP